MRWHVIFEQISVALECLYLFSISIHGLCIAVVYGLGSLPFCTAIANDSVFFGLYNLSNAAPVNLTDTPFFRILYPDVKV